MTHHILRHCTSTHNRQLGAKDYEVMELLGQQSTKVHTIIRMPNGNISWQPPNGWATRLGTKGCPRGCPRRRGKPIRQAAQRDSSPATAGKGCIVSGGEQLRTANHHASGWDLRISVYSSGLRSQLEPLSFSGRRHFLLWLCINWSLFRSLSEVMAPVLIAKLHFIRISSFTKIPLLKISSIVRGVGHNGADGSSATKFRA